MNHSIIPHLSYAIGSLNETIRELQRASGVAGIAEVYVLEEVQKLSATKDRLNHMLTLAKQERS